MQASKLSSSFCTTKPIGGSFDWQQPHDAASRDIVVHFCGEITNATSVASSIGCNSSAISPEHLLAQAYLKFGDSFVDKLQGAFAIALLDMRNNRLLLARDHLGREPLFYHQKGTGIRFASRLDDICCDQDIALDIDLHALNLYFAFQYFPWDRTAFKQIQKLPPGHLLSFAHTGHRCSAFWRPAFNGASQPIDGQDVQLSIESLADRLTAIMLNAYRGLTVGLAPKGVYASGGVDSSSNIVFLARSEQPSIALTAAFNESEFDESKDAAAIARFHNIEHRISQVDKHHLDHIVDIAAVLNEPIGDQAVLPTYVLLSEHSGCIDGIVSGEGGDEVFGPPRRFTHAEQLMQHCDDVTALASYYSEKIACVPNQLRQVLFCEQLHAEDIETGPWGMLANRFGECSSRNAFHLLKHAQMTSWLPENVLAKDRDLAGHFNQRVHFPLISADVVDFITALSAEQHYWCCRDKDILRAAINAYLPERIINKSKHRFLVPIAHWRSDELLNRARDVLSSTDSPCAHYLQWAGIGQVLDNYAKGNQNCDRHLWALLMLEYWLRHITAKRNKVGSDQ